MKTFILIICNAVLFSLVSPTLAQNGNSYVARNWVAEDGLPDNQVVGLAQTSDGYLWVATQGALIRFDGVRFQRVNLTNFTDYIVGTMRVLMLDPQGRVWLARDEIGTVFCFDGAQVRMFTADQGLSKNDTPCSMVVDRNGDLWITYRSDKVVRFNRDGKVDGFTVTNGLPSGSDICWLARDRVGTLWFAKGGQVGVFRNGKFEVLEKIGSTPVQITAARSGGIWICDGRRVLKFNESVPPVELGEILPDKTGDRSGLEPSVMMEDHAGAVWVGTVSGGLFRCDSNAVTRVELSNPTVLSLAEDREGSLWVGTRSGLDRLQRRLTSITKSSDGLPFQGVQSACQDATGALWLVGENGVLVRRQGTNWTVQSPSGDPAQAHVTCVTAGRNGSVWIGAWGGALYHWVDGQFKNMLLREELNQGSPRSLLVMKNGDLWIGTGKADVLHRLRGGKLQSFVLPPGYRFIRAMAEDAAGNFWAGATDGLLVRVAGDDLTVVTAPNSPSIRCLHGAANGDLWIGYGGYGVARLRDGIATRFNADLGLPNDFVSQILTDDRDNVWFAGNQGIFRVSERDFDDITEGLATRIWPVVYGSNENLPGLQANVGYFPNAWRSSDNQLFFCMLSGLAEVRLDDARLNYQPPKVFIERVVADGRTQTIYQNFSLTTSTNLSAPARLNSSGEKAELRLPPGVQQVQFEFTALSFVNPENVRFRYRLEGLDENWVDAGTRRTASYTHPPPGHYQFTVIACNNDGIWNKTGSTLSVTFEPYFWETLWFKSGVTLASFASLCGAVVLMIRHRHRLVVRKLEHQRALELERIRIARDLHDDLGVGLTEIGLLGDLAGTHAFVPEPTQDKLQEITVRARLLATSLDEIVWAINPANDVSQSLAEFFLEYAQNLLGQAGIRCRLKVVEPMIAVALSAEVRHGLFHAFKEALNNVIRHSGATEVQVTLSFVNGELCVRVADNGCGLVSSASGGSHNGLVGMRERLLNLGGRCEIDGNSGSGTTITFMISTPNKQP